MVLTCVPIIRLNNQQLAHKPTPIALPDSGPHLRLLDRAEISSEAPLSLGPLTASAILTAGGRAAQLAATAALQTGRAQSASDPDDDEELGDSWPRRDRNQRLIESQGALIRCASARSNPVSQLRFFINNQPVNVSRTLENSTLSYSDGLESSLVSFRIELGDFLVAPAAAQYDDEPSEQEREQQARAKSLDKAASLKRKTDKATRKAAGSEWPAGPRVKETPPSSASSTSTTSTSTTSTTSTTARPGNANAQVQFDEDGALSSRRPGAKQARPKALGAGKPKQPDASAANRNSERARPKATLDGGQPRADHDEPLPVSSADKPADQDGREASSTANWQTNSVIDSANYEPTVSATVDRDALGVEEQRVRGAGRLEQPRQFAYSNYIKIKCTSLVPAVGYEMTSELNVPLTLLIPARQLSEAMRAKQPEAGGRAQVGGSLQAPRAVLIDRLAQASTPPTGVVAAPNQTGPAAPPWSRPSAAQAPARASSQRPAPRARQQQQADQRASHLDESSGKRRQTGPGKYQ